jgi:hypothetical protein
LCLGTYCSLFLVQCLGASRRRCSTLTAVTEPLPDPQPTSPSLPPPQLLACQRLRPDQLALVAPQTLRRVRYSNPACANVNSSVRLFFRTPASPAPAALPPLLLLRSSESGLNLITKEFHVFPYLTIFFTDPGGLTTHPPPPGVSATNFVFGIPVLSLKFTFPTGCDHPPSGCLWKGSAHEAVVRYSELRALYPLWSQGACV